MHGLSLKGGGLAASLCKLLVNEGRFGKQEK